MGFFLIMKVLEGKTFVTRKITRGLTRIEAGIESCLYLGNLDSKEIGVCRRLYRNAMVDVTTKGTSRLCDRHRQN